MKQLIEKWWVGIGSIGLGQVILNVNHVHLMLQIVAAVIGIMIGAFTLLEKYHAYKLRKQAKQKTK